MTEAVVSRRGARRWRGGHPWIYRSDVAREPDPAVPGIVRVVDPNGRALGPALYSPASEIRLRMLDRADVVVDRGWWEEAIRVAAARRAGIEGTACRVVHAEGDRLPSLIVDRYGGTLSIQLLSAGLETCRADILAALESVLHPDGMLLRNDVPVREREGLDRTIEVVYGEVPETVEIETDGVRMLVDPRAGQKTGSFLDQRENRWLAGQVARGRGLDLCCYDGGFALHMAAACDRVVAVDQSEDALKRLARNAELNERANIEPRAGNVFDVLRDYDRAGERFDTIVLDPPAFAKSRRSVDRALKGYKELNLRAMKVLAPGGHLLTFSCSYHVSRTAFDEMLRYAASDSGRRIVSIASPGAGGDHPALLTVPETSYLKGALLAAQ